MYKTSIFILFTVLPLVSFSSSFKCIDEYNNIYYSSDGCETFSKPPVNRNNSVFKCKKSDGSTEFSDEACTGTSPEIVEIIEYNNTPGLTYNEKVRIYNYDNKIKQRKLNKKNNNNQPSNITYANERKCNDALYNIDQINKKMHKGYRASNYNYYHDKLIYYKKIRSDFCN